MEDILQNIARIIEKLRLNQEILAEKLGISQPGLNQILNGKRRLRIETLLQIANALNVDIAYIFSYPNEYIKKEDVQSVCEPMAEYLSKKKIDNLHDALIEIDKLQMEIRLQNRLLEEKERLINTIQQTKK